MTFILNTMTSFLNYFIKILSGLLSLVILFHLLILFKIIPYDITWGGRIKNDTEMYVFEAISILLNVCLIWVLFMKGNFVKYRFSGTALNIILWIFFAVFLLNTIGNFFAKTFFEKQFALLTGIIAFLLWKILKRKNNMQLPGQSSSHNK